MKISKSTFRVTPQDKDGKATGPEIVREVEFNVPETLEEVKALTGYSERALANTVSKYLIAHVAQGKVKKLLVKGEFNGKVQDLAFPTGERESGKKVENAYYTIARDMLNKLTPEARKEKEKSLNKVFKDVEIPESEENPGIYLFSLELKKKFEE